MRDRDAQHASVYTLSLPDCSSVNRWTILFRPCNILQRFVSDCAINVYQPNLCWRTADKRDLDILLAESRGCARIPIRRVADLGSIYMVKRSDHVRSQVQEGDFMLIQWWCGHCFFCLSVQLQGSSSFYQFLSTLLWPVKEKHWCPRAWSSVSPPHRSSEQLFCVFGIFILDAITLYSLFAVFSAIPLLPTPCKTSHSDSSAIFLQNDMCYTKAELSLPPAFVQEAMQSRHSRFISIYRIESDRENLNEALWRYVAMCGDMARHLVAICCWVDRDFLSVTQLTRLTKKWRDRRACSKGRVHCLVSQKFRHGTFIYFYDLVLVQLPRVKWFEVTIAESRKKSLNNAMLFARDAALDDNKEPLDWNGVGSTVGWGGGALASGVFTFMSGA